jgi:hypothetical protein
MFLFFAKQCQQGYYIYTYSFKNYCSRVDWLFIVKRFMGRVQVVQEGNDEENARDDIFQINKLVDAYRVASSTNLEKNSNFYIAGNIFIDVDTW